MPGLRVYPIISAFYGVNFLNPNHFSTETNQGGRAEQKRKGTQRRILAESPERRGAKLHGSHKS